MLFSHLATGRYSCIWPPTLFALVLGEGICSFIILVFLSARGGGCIGDVLRDARQTPGVGQIFS